MRYSGMKIILMLVMLGTTTVAPTFDSALAAGKRPTSKAKTKSKKKPQKSKETKSGEMDLKEEEFKKSSSSSSNIEVLANAGISPSPLLGFGGTVGSIKEGGSGIEASLTFAAGKAGTISASVTHIGGRYRMGIMKLGYIAAGGGFRMASGKWFVLNNDESAEYNAGASLNAVTLDAAAGAQIKFGSILVGADLLGISFPVFKLGVKKTLPSESDYNEDDANAQQGKFDKVAAGMTLTLFKAGVGMMF